MSPRSEKCLERGTNRMESRSSSLKVSGWGNSSVGKNVSTFNFYFWQCDSSAASSVVSTSHLVEKSWVCFFLFFYESMFYLLIPFKHTCTVSTLCAHKVWVVAMDAHSCWEQKQKKKHKKKLDWVASGHAKSSLGPFTKIFMWCWSLLWFPHGNKRETH